MKEKKEKSIDLSLSANPLVLDSASMFQLTTGTL
jgi:hypothetical protein